MALNNDYTDYQPVPANNILPVPQGMPAGSLPSQLYPIIRQLMAALFNTGTELRALYTTASVSGYGLTSSYASSTSFSVTTGAAIDTTGTLVMKLTGPWIKTLAPFAVGSGNGGLDTGTVAISQWYWEHLISTAAGVTDVLYSTSYSSPTLPTGYTKFVPIGLIHTTSTGALEQFTMVGNRYIPGVNIDTNAATNLPAAYTLAVVGPVTGVALPVRYRFALQNGGGGATVAILVQSPFEAAATPNTTTGLVSLQSATNTAEELQTIVNASGQVGISSANAASSTYSTSIVWIEVPRFLQ